MKLGDKYALRLTRLEASTTEIAKKVVFEGAKLVADATKAEIEKLPTEKQKKGADGERGMLVSVTEEEKALLTAGFGVSPIRNDDGMINAKTGYDGYAAEYGDYGGKPSKKYPKGVPIPLLARSVESGTYFRKKNPFNKRAIRTSKAAAERAMAKTATEEIEKAMK